MNNNWSTPQEFFDALDSEFSFDLDVCAQFWNAKCLRYFSPEQDGLRKQWAGTCWMNPPYGREIEEWIQKAYEESLRGCTVVCLIPARTETAWFHDYCLKGEVRFVRKRIWFTDINGRTGRPRFGSAIVIFRPPKEGGCSLMPPKIVIPGVVSHNRAFLRRKG
jgi:phage N-6-adenine-methyltransferase